MNPPRARRRLRLAVPFAVVVMVFTITGVAHAMQQPDVTSPDFLNPGSSAAVGGRSLSDRLHARGIPVQRFDRSRAALTSAYRGDATLFIPAPSLMHPYYLRMLKLLPESTRVVLVAPSALTLQSGLIPVGTAASRWATGTAVPRCALPEAERAGRATVLGLRYGPAGEGETDRCYAGALVGLRVGGTRVLLVGASEPFRNDRISEVHNADLATGLLGTRSRVVWLDLHRPEQPPDIVDGGSGGVPGQLSDGDPGDPDFPVGGDGPGGDGSGGSGRGDPAGGNQGSRSQNPDPLWTAFPGWLWWTLALLGLAAVVGAFAAGRRFGPLVSEPLPVAVRANETVEGRGRLYRRSRDRGFALATLRRSVVLRLATALDLPPDAPRELMIRRIAARTGRATDEVENILYGAAPDSDAALVRDAAQLERLLHDLRDGTGRPTPRGHGTS